MPAGFSGSARPVNRDRVWGVASLGRKTKKLIPGLSGGCILSREEGLLWDYVLPMNDTPNLALPYIFAAQAQKHVTHNEAIRALDCIVQLAVISLTLTTPPATPAEGDRYIVPSAASGDWSDQTNKIAAYQDGAWAFYTPKDGWRAWVTSANVLAVYAAGTWSALPSGGGGSGVSDHGLLTGLSDDDHPQYHTDARGDVRYMPIDPQAVGINATADTTNRLAVASPASLFNHDGNGHQVKVNKNSAGDTASFLFQSGFSGRAEIGLAGDDDFHFKVSPDGAAWHEGIKIDRATGRVDFPNTGAFPSYRNRVINPCGAITQAALASTADGNYTGFDQWLALTQANAVTPSQLVDVSNDIATMMRMTQANATAQRMGWLQPLEASAVRDLRGKPVALQFVARMSAAATLRYAIIEWTGAADNLVLDVVNDWTDASFTPAHFFKSSNLKVAASGSKALSADTLTTIDLSGEISSSMNNVLLFSWTDAAQAQNVTLDMGNVWFGTGAAAPAIFEPPAPDDDLKSCLRYLSVSAPGTTLPAGVGVVASSTSVRIAVPITVAMRVTPSASFVGGSGLSASFLYYGTTNTTPTAMSVNSMGSSVIWVVLTIPSTSSGPTAVWAFSSGASGSLVFDARL